MTDTTDHRAQAEEWLAKTEQLVGPNEDDETMTVLLAIGHRLGDIADILRALGEGQPEQVDNRTDDEKAHDVGSLRFHYASGEDDPFTRTMPR